MWYSDGKQHISQSKFKNDFESLNTDNVLSVILKIERDNAMKPNLMSFQTPFTYEMEYMKHVFPIRR